MVRHQPVTMTALTLRGTSTAVKHIGKPTYTRRQERVSTVALLEAPWKKNGLQLREIPPHVAPCWFCTIAWVFVDAQVW